VDVLPTLLTVAGGNPASATAKSAPPLAGRSLTPAFAKSGAVKREYLYFNHSNNRAIRIGDQKLVALGQNGPWELYDLRRDRAEQRNLAREQPRTVASMSQLWRERDTEFAKGRETAVPSTKPLLNRQSW
jgi:arylsulfatase A-like enzyme